MKCKYCGGELTVEITPDDSYYQASITLLPKPDTRFKGERYRIKCPSCGRTGHAIHRDDMPDELGYVATKADATRRAKWFYDNIPDYPE